MASNRPRAPPPVITVRDTSDEVEFLRSGRGIVSLISHPRNEIKANFEQCGRRTLVSIIGPT